MDDPRASRGVAVARSEDLRGLVLVTFVKSQGQQGVRPSRGTPVLRTTTSDYCNALRGPWAPTRAVGADGFSHVSGSQTGRPVVPSRGGG